MVWINAQLSLWISIYSIGQFQYGSREAVQTKVTRRTSPLGFQQSLVTVCKHTLTFICLFPHSGGKHFARNLPVLQHFSQRYSLRHVMSSLHFSARETTEQDREGASTDRAALQSLSHLCQPCSLLALRLCLAGEHTGWSHFLSHKYQMLSTDQHCITTISENTATNNFRIWSFVALNLQFLLVLHLWMYSLSWWPDLHYHMLSLRASANASVVAKC